MTDKSSRWSLGRHVAPARFVAFVVVLIVASAGAAIPFKLALGRALMTGFDIAGALFLVSLWPLLDDETDEMRQRARDNDANRAGLLAITGMVTLVILVAVASELQGKSSPATIALVIATLTLAWLFSNTVYALHYAHVFYTGAKDGGDSGGVDFPECDEPDYWDFIYFSFTLGMTFQTSDVSITTRRMRRIAIGQCLAAFVFNLGVLAFTINVLGS